MKRIFAILAVVLCVACAMLPVTAFAEDDPTGGGGGAHFGDYGISGLHPADLVMASTDIRLAGYARGLSSSYDMSTLSGADTLYDGYLKGESNSWPISSISVSSDFYSTVRFGTVTTDNVFAVRYVFVFSEEVSASDFGNHVLMCIPIEKRDSMQVSYSIVVDDGPMAYVYDVPILDMYGIQKFCSLYTAGREYRVDSTGVGCIPIEWLSNAAASGTTVEVTVYLDDANVDIVTPASAPSGLTGLLEYAFDIAMSGGGMVLDFFARLFRTELIAPLVSLTISGLMMALIIKFAG